MVHFVVYGFYSYSTSFLDWIYGILHSLCFYVTDYLKFFYLDCKIEINLLVFFETSYFYGSFDYFYLSYLRVMQLLVSYWVFFVWFVELYKIYEGKF